MITETTHRKTLLSLCPCGTPIYMKQNNGSYEKFKIIDTSGAFVIARHAELRSVFYFHPALPCFVHRSMG